MLLFLFGCADPRIDELESRLAATQARLSAAEAEMERIKAVHAGEATPLERDPQSGEMVPLLTSEGVTSCAFGALQGIATAELAYDAGFDKFPTDFATLGWSFDASRGCHRYLAARVSVEESERGRVDNFVAVAVVTRGEDRGRSFEIDKRLKVAEVGRRSEVEVLAFLAEPGWIGSAQ